MLTNIAESYLSRSGELCQHVPSKYQVNQPKPRGTHRSLYTAGCAYIVGLSECRLIQNKALDFSISGRVDIRSTTWQANRPYGNHHMIQRKKHLGTIAPLASGYKGWEILGRIFKDVSMASIADAAPGDTVASNNPSLPDDGSAYSGYHSQPNNHRSINGTPPFPSPRSEII